MGRLYLLALLSSTVVCVSALTLTDPQESFARFERWDASKKGSLMQFRFKTYLADCLLLYQGTSGTKDSELFIIELSGGQLSILNILDHGREPRAVQIGERLNDVKWHTVELERINEHAVNISLDGVRTKTVLSNAHSWKAAVAFLYFGGMPSTDLDHQSSVFSVVLKKKRFVGCLDGPAIKGDIGRPTRKAMLLDYKGLVKGCIDSCDQGRRYCQNGGECVNMFTTSECDCRQTAFDGPQCQHESPVLNLRSTDFVTYQVPPATTLQDRVQFRFKTSRSDGVVLDTNFYHDFFVVELKSGTLHVTWNLGAQDLAVSTGNETFHDHTWHFVEIQRSLRHIYVTVDDQLYISKKFPGRFVGFDMRGGDRRVYVGKAMTSRKLNSRGFHGCLQKLTFNGADVLRGLKTGVKDYFLNGTASWKCDQTVAKSPTRNPAQERNTFLVLNAGLSREKMGRKFPWDKFDRAPCAIDDEDCVGGGSVSGSGEEHSGDSSGGEAGSGSSGGEAGSGSSGGEAGSGSTPPTKLPAVTSSPEVPKTKQASSPTACSHDDEDCGESGSGDDQTPVPTPRSVPAPTVIAPAGSEAQEKNQAPAIIGVAVVSCLLVAFLMFVGIWCYRHGGKGYSLSNKKMSVTLYS